MSAHLGAVYSTLAVALSVVATVGALAVAAFTTRQISRQTARLGELQAAVRNVPPEPQSFDIFLTHAHEDAKVAHALAEALREQGFSVWDADNELQIGDSLVGRVADGMARSRHGLLLISPAFMRAPWPRQEFRILRELAGEGRTDLLPVWVGVSERDVRRFSSQLADTVAIQAEGQTPEQIAGKIAAKIDR